MFINQNKSYYNQHIFAMRNKFVYPFNIKMHISGFGELLETIFCILLIVEAFPLQKVVEVVEEVVVSWWEIRWMWQMRQNFIAQFVQLLKRWVLRCAVGRFHEKWAHAIDQCWLQALQFLVYLINLLSILLKCNGFTRPQKTSGSDGQQTTKQ